MDHDDYETLQTTSFAKNMTAGATAGVLEHCIMYPMDSVKTRMQSLSPVSSGQTIVSTYRNMVTKEGWLRPVRGMGAVVAGAGPAHALYFATYEYSKEVSQTLFPQHRSLCIMTSAVTATLIHDAISNPAEVIKQRLQMYNSPYKSIVQCARGVYATEGVRAFYRSYNTQLIMNLPYQNIHFATYEFIQNLLNTEHKYNPPVHMLAGALAGGAASAITTPLDVVKTLLNTQETGIGLTRGMREACKQIYSVAGPAGFFKGLYARVLYAMPATAICWSTYEFAKFLLSHQTREEYSSALQAQHAASPHQQHQLHQHISTKDVLAGAAAEVRLDDTIRLGYVLPSTQAATNGGVAGAGVHAEQEEAGERKTSSSSSSSGGAANDQSTSKSSSLGSAGGSGSLLPRELPSMSGAGVYSSALSLNTMHTTEPAAAAGRRTGLGFAEARGCST